MSAGNQDSGNTDKVSAVQKMFNQQVRERLDDTEREL